MTMDGVSNFPSYGSGLTPQPQQSPLMSPALSNFGLASTPNPVMPPSAASLYPPPATPGGPMTPFSPATPASEGPGMMPLKPQLQNIVCTVNLGCKLDLKKIALHARNAEYNPKRFAAEQAKLAARKYARIVQKLGFPAKFLDFKIQNMVGSCDVKFPIRLEGLVLTHGQFTRMVKPRIVLLIFVSGKVVLTGAKVRDEIYEAFNNIYPILKGFKKQ
ncbi:hypothetical protein KUTeg_013519 [Tegillarca granosa]|uniref:TATA-box-binding protein n=1 Tax=Tegillarca granosa TaxID=220873 RepID=A0ABQ9EU00_TEGGR|nr:hypothetical protein KUTeg_013519 [Tegillarca granosa]